MKISLILLIFGILTACIPAVAVTGQIVGSGDNTSSGISPTIQEGDSNELKVIQVDWSRPNPALVANIETQLSLYDPLYKSRTDSNRTFTGLDSPIYWQNFRMPSKGNVKVPIFLVDFPDYPHSSQQTPLDVALAFNENTLNNDPYKSVNNYYDVSSYQQLNLTGQVYDWIRAPKERDFYSDESLLSMVLNYKNSAVDFSQFDSNNDGYIDGMIVIFTGPEVEATPWWGHSNIASYPIDGKSTAGFAFIPYETRYGEFDIQTSLHEIGHCLGLPDYYDYNASIGLDGGVGGADMMDSAWGDHNAFSKYLLGWINPTVIQRGDSELISLREFESYPDAVIVLPVGWLSDREFFITQYRYPGIGMDPVAGPSGSSIKPGLWIWHVDATLEETGINYRYNNQYTDRKLLRLMEADGLEQIEANNDPHTASFNDGDLYTEGYRLTPLSMPNSKNYMGIAGEGSDVWINQLAEVRTLPSLSPKMRARYTVCQYCSNPVVADFQYTWVGPDGLTLNITDSSFGDPVTLKIIWGDGSPEECHGAGCGDEFPYGNISHEYSTPDDYRITYTVVRDDTQKDTLLGRVPRDYWGEYSTDSIPSSMEFGEVGYKKIVWMNRGTETWTGSDSIWTNWGDTHGFSFSQQPASFMNVAPEEDLDDIYEITAPSKSGIYSFTPRLEKDGNPISQGVPKQIKVPPSGTIGTAVVRPSQWNNWILDTLADGIVEQRDHYGMFTDVPVIADFNNDWEMDRAVFRDGEWIIDYGMDGTVEVRKKFGMAGDIPLVARAGGDSTGDSGFDTTLDLVVFRNGEWIIDYEMDGTVDIRDHFGMSGDIPLIGDFNNDGLMDRAVFRKTVFNNWIFDYGMDSTVNARDHYGTTGDIPVVGDFNEDGVMDRAVFRDGEWIVDYNIDGTVNTRPHYGMRGDRPIVWNW